MMESFKNFFASLFSKSATSTETASVPTATVVDPSLNVAMPAQAESIYQTEQTGTVEAQSHLIVTSGDHINNTFVNSVEELNAKKILIAKDVSSIV